MLSGEKAEGNNSRFPLPGMDRGADDHPWQRRRGAACLNKAEGGRRYIDRAHYQGCVLAVMVYKQDGDKSSVALWADGEAWVQGRHVMHRGGLNGGPVVAWVGGGLLAGSTHLPCAS